MSPNRVLAIVVVAVAVAAVVAAVLAANRPEVELDTSTPEGVVQAYLRAVVDGDADAAAAHLSPRTGCDAGNLADAYVPAGVRVVLVDTGSGGDAATVTVEIVESDRSGVLGGYDYVHEERFTLETAGDSWLITEAPWPLLYCREG